MPRCTCTDPPHPVPPPWWILVLPAIILATIILVLR